MLIDQYTLKKCGGCGSDKLSYMDLAPVKNNTAFIVDRGVFCFTCNQLVQTVLTFFPIETAPKGVQVCFWQGGEDAPIAVIGKVITQKKVKRVKPSIEIAEAIDLDLFKYWSPLPEMPLNEEEN